MDTVALTVKKFGHDFRVVSSVIIEYNHSRSRIFHLTVYLALEPIKKICFIGWLCEAIVETLSGRREGTDNRDSATPVRVTRDDQRLVCILPYVTPIVPQVSWGFVKVKYFKVSLFEVDELKCPVALEFKLGFGRRFTNEFEIGPCKSDAVAAVPNAQSLGHNPNSEFLVY